MVNRCQRRLLLILFFLIQFILFSSYTYRYYQNNDFQIDQSTTTTTILQDLLPADLIEKSNRLLLKKNYKNSKNSHSQSKNDLLTNEKLQTLNISFVQDIDQQKTIVQCPLLPTNLGSLNQD